MNSLRDDLPPLPERMTRLPVDGRGYPVPWFVAWLDEGGIPVPRGMGTPDFRVVGVSNVATALRQGLCWICGERLGTFLTFVIGPMCAINRVSSEPPNHLECGDYAGRACPFLVNPRAPRREKKMPPGWIEPAGTMIRRNPGVALVWTTKSYRLMREGDGVLFLLGPPEHLRWYREGRPATRSEVVASIESGVPLLRESAEAEGQASVRELELMVDRAMRLLPGAAP